MIGSQTSSSSSSSSSSSVYDVIIIGTGAMGVSAAYHLAKGGKKVLALERYTVAHANGSSHGETRITRLAYWEHPDYVSLTYTHTLIGDHSIAIFSYILRIMRL